KPENLIAREALRKQHEQLLRLSRVGSEYQAGGEQTGAVDDTPFVLNCGGLRIRPDSVTRSPPPCHTAIRPDTHNLVTRRIPVLPFIITRMRATHPRRLAPTALHVRRLHPDPDGLLDNGLAQLTT